MSKFRISVLFIPQFLGCGTGYGRPLTLEPGSVQVPVPLLAAMQWTMAEHYHSLGVERVGILTPGPVWHLRKEPIPGRHRVGFACCGPCTKLRSL